MAFFGLDKFAKFFRVIKENGGVRMSIYRLYRESDLKVGTLVGTDFRGNKYYENKDYFMGRNRWVIYHPSTGSDFEGSLIPPEWFGWMHYKTDTPPTVTQPVQYGFIERTPVNNVTGTDMAFMPYTTTKPKVEAWVPPKASAS